MTDHELTQLQERGHVLLLLSAHHVPLSSITDGLATLGLRPDDVRLNVRSTGVLELSVIDCKPDCNGSCGRHGITPAGFERYGLGKLRRVT